MEEGCLFGLGEDDVHVLDNVDEVADAGVWFVDLPWLEAAL